MSGISWSLSRHHADHEQPSVVEADRLRRETDDGFSEQGRASEQHHGQRDLTGDDDALRTAAESGQASPRSKRVDRAGSTDACQRRRGAAEDRHRGADDHREHQHARIDRDQVDARQARRCECSRATGANHHAAMTTRDATGGAEQRALGEHLPRHAATAPPQARGARRLRDVASQFRRAADRRHWHTRSPGAEPRRQTDMYSGARARSELIVRHRAPDATCAGCGPCPPFRIAAIRLAA